MKTWWRSTTLLVAGTTMLVGAAYAQTTPSSGPTKGKDSAGAATKSDSMKSDTSSMKLGQMAGGNREQVKAVQQALKDKGHDPGAVDGVMGPKTQAALREFQSKEGLKASGRADRETMAKLGVEAKSGAAADTGRGTPPAASPGSGTTGGTSSTPGSTPGGSTAPGKSTK